MASWRLSSKRTWAVGVLALSLILSGCAAAPRLSDSSPASTAPLIPVALFFANRESNYDYKVSPDGGRLAWLASAGGRLTVHFRELQGGDARTIDTHSTRSLGTFRWAADSRHVLFEQDRDGDQNQHVYLADTERPGERPINLTPIGAARAAIHRVLLVDPDYILVVHNARTRRGFDLVRINVRTGDAAVVAENPGDVVQWITDPHGSLRGRIRAVGNSERIVDAVDSAVRRGVADRQRVGIMGWSYGGYATLVGMTFTPGVFACGVDIVGSSNLVSLLETRHTYWTWHALRPYWYKYAGDPALPEDRQRMEAKSPLFHAHRAQGPLLIVHGANDPNVQRQESDQMVEALRRAGKDVEYVVFADEGHGGFDWRNNVKLFETVERFLARHLGGRGD